MDETGLIRPSFSPRNWPGWVMVSFLWALGRLPRPIGLALVAPLAPVLYYGMRRRRRIAERNLAACLPELAEDQRRRILRANFRSLARMLAEMAWCWAAPAQDLQAIADVRGEHHLNDAISRGRGVLVVTAHLTCLEIGARILGERHEGKGVYRPLGSAVLEWYQNRARRHYSEGMISKRDIRSMVRYLRGGGRLWYAPDQDVGARSSVFAPFFGIPTATVLATHRLPSLTGCVVLTMLPRFDRTTRRYVVELGPVLEGFPSDDPVADLARINAVLEAQVRKVPDQYWWIHRRFKTRPEGESPFYAGL